MKRFILALSMLLLTSLAGAFNFGYTGNDGTSDSVNSNLANGTWYVIPESSSTQCNIQGYWLWCSGSVAFKCCLAYPSGTPYSYTYYPNTYVDASISSEGTAPASVGWVYVPVVSSTCSLMGQTTVHMLVNTPSDSLVTYDTGGQKSGGHCYSSPNAYTGFPPATFVNTGSAANDIALNFYVVYSTGTTTSASSLVTAQIGNRPRNDDGTETTATWAGSENAAFTGPTGTNTRWRYCVNTSTLADVQAFKLDYKKSTDANYVAVSTFQPTRQFPNFVLDGTDQSSASAITLTLPTGAVDGDLLIAAIETSSQTITLSGWNQLCYVAPWQTSGAQFATALTMFWTIYRSSSAPTLVTSDSGDHQIGNTFAFHNVKQSNPIDVVATSSGVASTSLTVMMPGLTTSGSKETLFGLYISTTRVSNTAGYSAWVNTDLTSVTEADDYHNTAGNGGGFGAFYGYKDTAGAVGISSATTVLAVFSKNFAAATVAINSADPAVYNVIIATSPNIAAGGGTATTAQMTPPSGKTTGSFSAGVISSDKNPTPSVSVTQDYYTELEWNLMAGWGAQTNDIYYFKIHGMNIDQSTTAQWTIGTSGGGGGSSASSSSGISPIWYRGMAIGIGRGMR